MERYLSFAAQRFKKTRTALDQRFGKLGMDGFYLLDGEQIPAAESSGSGRKIFDRVPNVY